MLADVGTTWYTWLEQGRDVRPSNEVLSALAAALPTRQAISYQGQVITPLGGLATVLPSPVSDQAGD